MEVVMPMDKVRALIVDDSAVMRKIIERCLRQAGVPLAGVLEAGNGDDALKVLAQNQVDIILSDINMPVMNGLEFVRRLPSVENSRGVPVVMITTEAGEAQVLEALSYGAKGYIRKPFTPEQVAEHVIPLLRG
jgi:two-component system chemotaxis response regulator CheY